MHEQSESNYRWFRNNLSNFIPQHKGLHALLHDCDVDDYFRSSLEAIAAGLAKYGEGNFSVELVDDRMEDLGFYSHVGSALHA